MKGGLRITAVGSCTTLQRPQEVCCVFLIWVPILHLGDGAGFRGCVVFCPCMLTAPNKLFHTIARNLRIGAAEIKQRPIRVVVKIMVPFWVP